VSYKDTISGCLFVLVRVISLAGHATSQGKTITTDKTLIRKTSRNWIIWETFIATRIRSKGFDWFHLAKSFCEKRDEALVAIKSMNFTTSENICTVS
jgi:hypothetical protein